MIRDIWERNGKKVWGRGRGRGREGGRGENIRRTVERAAE